MYQLGFEPKTTWILDALTTKPPAGPNHLLIAIIRYIAVQSGLALNLYPSGSRISAAREGGSHVVGQDTQYMYARVY